MNTLPKYLTIQNFIVNLDEVSYFSRGFHEGYEVSANSYLTIVMKNGDRLYTTLEFDEFKKKFRELFNIDVVDTPTYSI